MTKSLTTYLSAETAPWHRGTQPWVRCLVCARANYLAVGMIYLQDNPLLRETALSREHIKGTCLLGHWGSSPWSRRFDLRAHAKPADPAPNDARHESTYVGGLGPCVPPGVRRTHLPRRAATARSIPGQNPTDGAKGCAAFFKQFSFHRPTSGSHCTPETPGSIHEGR